MATPSLDQLTRPSIPRCAGSRPASTRGVVDDGESFFELRARCDLGEPPVGKPADAPVGGRGLAADPDRDRSLSGKWREPGAGDALELAGVGHHRFAQEPTEQRDLLGHPSSPCGERGAEGLVLDGIPPDPDAQSKSSVREQVDLGRLLGDEGGLPLRQDDHAGDELELCACGQVAEQHERLVKCRVDVVGATPRGMHVRIGSEHMVVREQVREPEILHARSVPPHVGDGTTDLRLWEHDPELHHTVLSPAGR